MTIQTTSLNPRYVYVQPTMPTDTTIGKLWYNTSNNILYTSDGTTYNEMKTDLTPIYNSLGHAQLQILDLAAKNSLTASTPSNFKGDVYTDNNGWLDTIDTTNTTASFTSGYYHPTAEVVDSDPSEVSTTSTSYVVVKTFYVNRPIEYITSELKVSFADVNHNVFLKVRFTDATGSWESSQTLISSTSYTSVTVNNPVPERILTKVEIMLRVYATDYVGFERNTILIKSTTPPFTGIVQTNPQSIQSGFQRFMIIATEETSGTSSVTYDVSFDGGVNYQTGLVSSQIYDIEHQGETLILKQNLNWEDYSDIVKVFGYGILLI